MKPAKNQNDVSTSSTLRRRGRPTGSNRIPLSKTERKARNALYERERRQDMATAIRELAEAVGCSANSSQDEVLATAIAIIQGENSYTGYSIEDYNRINKKLEDQIVTLQGRLGLDDESFDNLRDEEFTYSVPQTSQYTTRIERPFHQETTPAVMPTTALTQEDAIIPELNLFTENEMKIVFNCLDAALFTSQ